MANLSSIFKSQQKVRLILDGQDVIVLDCSVSEKHSRESTPTEFEIENGQSITDHILIKPFTLHLTGIISDTPLDLDRAVLTTAASVVLPAPAIVVGAAGYALATADDGASRRSVTAYQQLLNLQKKRRPFSVWTSLQLYLNMFIKSISVPREAGTGQILQFDLELAQLLLVSPQSVNILKYANGDLSAPKTDKGKQETGSAALNAVKDGHSTSFNGINNLLSNFGISPVSNQ